jgi:ribosomal protein L33
LLKIGFDDIVSEHMAQDNLVKLVNKETGETYWSTKNRKKLAGIKLEFKKYSRKLRKVVTFKESKK